MHDLVVDRQRGSRDGSATKTTRSSRPKADSAQKNRREGLPRGGFRDQLVKEGKILDDAHLSMRYRASRYLSGAANLALKQAEGR